MRSPARGTESINNREMILQAPRSDADARTETDMKTDMETEMARAAQALLDAEKAHCRAEAAMTSSPAAARGFWLMFVVLAALVGWAFEIALEGVQQARLLGALLSALTMAVIGLSMESRVARRRLEAAIGLISLLDGPARVGLVASAPSRRRLP